MLTAYSFSIFGFREHNQSDYGIDYLVRSMCRVISWIVAKLRLKLKKVGKTTKSFRYDLNQIPYDYTAEMTNRFKGLDMIECLKNYEWRFLTLYRRW